MCFQKLDVVSLSCLLGTFIFWALQVFWLQVTNLAHVKVTKRASNIEYAIRDVIVHTQELIKNGKKIYYLNIGDPAAFDFKTPQYVKDALCKAIDRDNNYYSPSEGQPELREAIVRKEKRVNDVDITANNVLITEGISEGIQMILGSAWLRRATKSSFQDQLIHPTFPTPNFSKAPQSPTKPSKRKVGCQTSMICAAKFQLKPAPS